MQAHQEELTTARARYGATAADIAKIDREAANAQLGMYGDLVTSAKGFFREGSKGYKALATAEKVYRAAQLAMSIQAMVQSALETGTFVAGRLHAESI